MPINSSVKLCNARARTRDYQQCRQPAMPNGFCRMHFGKGIGPKTEEGKLKRARANLKHGRYTNAAMAEKKMMRMMMGWRHDMDFDESLLDETNL